MKMEVSLNEINCNTVDNFQFQMTGLWQLRIVWLVVVTRINMTTDVVLYWFIAMAFDTWLIEVSPESHMATTE